MKRFSYWVPVIIWMAIIFALSTRQRLQVSEEVTINFIFFKTLHVLEYAALYFLSYRAMKMTYPKAPKHIWTMWAFVITIGYATTDELHQLFVPTREGHVRDVIIDAVGATLAWISIVKLLPILPKKLRTWAGM